MGEMVGFQETDVSSLTHLKALVNQYIEQERYSEAEPLLIQLLRHFETTQGTQHNDTASCMNYLAGVYDRQARYAESEALYRKTFPIFHRNLGVEHPYTATSQHNIGIACYRQGKYTEAEPFLVGALESYRTIYAGGEHAFVATALHSLAELRRAEGEMENAYILHKEALAIRVRVLPLQHLDTANSYRHLAEIALERQDYATAEAHYHSALKTYETRGRYHARTLECLSALAQIYEIQGIFTLSEPLYQQVQMRLEEQLYNDQLNTVSGLHTLAELYKRFGRFEEAEPLFLSLLAILTQQRGEAHPDTARLLSNIGHLYALQSRFYEAEPFYTQALEALETHFCGDHPDIAALLEQLGEVVLAQGRNKEVSALLLRAFEMRTRLNGRQNVETIASRDHYVLAALQMNQNPDPLLHSLYLAR
jgi:tetratricopeptide (TPR) repeat protein